MRKIQLKDTEIHVSDADEKYLDTVLEIANVKAFNELTLDLFTAAMNIEKLTSGETVHLESGARVRMGKK